MGKRLGLVGTAIALVALAVGLISPAWGSSGDNHKQRRFGVDAVTTEQNFEGPAPAPSRPPGCGDHKAQEQVRGLPPQRLERSR
jgi:hypothetical protein